jgi:origin recognition complex subunit 2
MRTKSWKAMKEIVNQNAPQALSDSDSELSPVQISGNLPKEINNIKPPKPVPIISKKQSQSISIPDYFKADKLEFGSISELENRLDPLIPFVRTHDKTLLIKDYSQSFSYWSEILLQGFNILLFGPGSKISVLDEYQETLERDSYDIIRVNAYNPTITVRKILNHIIKLLSNAERSNLSIDRVLCNALELLDAPETKVFLLLDSLDSNTIIDPESQLILSRLSSHNNLYMIATIDNPYLLYRWSIDTNVKYNFLYVPCPTFASYMNELTYIEGLKVFEYGTTHNQLRGIEYVLKSLTGTQRSILKVLAQAQIKEPNGLIFKNFLDKCIEETLVLSSKQLKDFLVEAVDHHIAAYKIGQRGETIIYLKMDPEILKNKIQ